MINAGYSGKPLREKLGYVDGMKIQLVDAPDNYAALLDMTGLTFVTHREDCDIVHIFSKTGHGLDDKLTSAMSHIMEKGFVWVSWPKKASGVPSDLDEDGIRGSALPLGLVDTKVCAIDDIWSGLKLMKRKK